MLTIALTLQHWCAGTLRQKGAEQEVSAECPENVACARPSARQFGALFGFNMRGVSGEAGLCAASLEEAECQKLCKTACTRRRRAGTYEQTWLGQTSVASY